jgi:MFS transporter, DHA1 family, multidrug resistance protein
VQRLPGRLLALLSVVAVVGPLSMELYLPTLPEVSATLGLSEPQSAWSLLGCLLGLSVGQVLWGPVADGLGRRWTIVGGVAAWTAVSAGCAVVSDPTLFIVLRIAQGLAGAAGLTVSRAVLADVLEPEALPRPLARLMILTAAFTILSPVIGGALLSFTDWRGVFTILAGIGAVTTLWVLVGLPESRTTAIAGRGPRERLLADPSFSLATLTSGMAFAAVILYVTFSPEVLRGGYGLDSLEFGVAFAGTAVAMVTGAQLSPRLLNRVPADQLVTSALGCAIGFQLVLALVSTVADGLPPLPVTLVLLFASNLSLGVAMPLGAAAALAGSTGRAGTASGLVGGLQFGMGAVVGLVVAPVHPGGLTATAVSMAAASAIGVVAWTARRGLASRALVAAAASPDL